jgi:hypothetical protein
MDLVGVCPRLDILDVANTVSGYTVPKPVLVAYVGEGDFHFTAKELCVKHVEGSTIPGKDTSRHLLSIEVTKDEDILAGR